MKFENKTFNENDKKRNKQWIRYFNKEYNINDKMKNLSKEEKINMDYLNSEYIKKNKENKDSKYLNNSNNPKLNYDYGDNVDTEIINEIANSKIKLNIRDNLNKMDNEQLNNNKIIDMTYDDSLKKYNNHLKNVKSYDNLYKELKRRYNNNQSDYGKYMNNISNRNYLTFNSKFKNNNISYNLFEKEVKTPLRNIYQGKINDINLNYTENKTVSIKNEQILYLENKLKEYEKERINYINQIKIYKNNFEIISDFFSFISQNFIQDIFPKDQIIQIDKENILYDYCKKLKEYISKINKELNDYKYKYEKLLSLDTNRQSLSTKYTLNINKQNKEFKTQNNSFSESNDNIGNSLIENDNISNNLNLESNIYKSLEKRVLLIEKKLFEKNKEKGIKIRTKSSPKISITKNKNNKTKEKYLENFMSQPSQINSTNRKKVALLKNKNKNNKNGTARNKKK